jgi:hypothetical protein
VASPFPGMDPYLERPSEWPDLHGRLIPLASNLLSRQLLPNYYVRIEERVYVSDENDPGRQRFAPDLRILRGTATGVAGGLPVQAPSGAAAAVAEPVEETTFVEEEVHERYLTVVDAAQRTVVTVIEILSPSNKVRNSRGRQEYLHKRHEIMRSPAHLVEIDLLRAGERSVPDERLEAHDYLAHVSRAHRRPMGTLWPIRVEQQLPTIPIPLKNSDPDARLDLQTMLTTAYDDAGYGVQIDYRAEPQPPLSAEQAMWADRLLRERGLR